MGKIVIEYNTDYDKGEVVVFQNYAEGINHLKVGIIEGYSVDDGNIWYNIRVSKDCVYSYSNNKDVAEDDIICKIEGDKAERCRCTIMKG